MRDVLTIALRLRIVRDSWHVSQTQLAEASGLTRNTVSLIENGNDDTLKVSTLRALSLALDVPMSTWFLADAHWLEWLRIYKANAHPRLGENLGLADSDHNEGWRIA